MCSKMNLGETDTKVEVIINVRITHFSLDFDEFLRGLAVGRTGAVDLVTFFTSYLTDEKAHIMAITIVG